MPPEPRWVLRDPWGNERTFPASAFRELVENGKIAPDTAIRRETDEEFQPASEYCGLLPGRPPRPGGPKEGRARTGGGRGPLKTLGVLGLVAVGGVVAYPYAKGLVPPSVREQFRSEEGRTQEALALTLSDYYRVESTLLTEGEGDVLAWFRNEVDPGRLDRWRRSGKIAGTTLTGIHQLYGAQGPGMQRGISTLEDAAQMGDPLAMIFLARAFETGTGVFPDEAHAFELYSRAADAGSPLGRFHVARCLAGGIGVTVDPAAARRQLEPLAEDSAGAKRLLETLPELPPADAGPPAVAVSPQQRRAQDLREEIDVRLLEREVRQLDEEDLEYEQQQQQQRAEALRRQREAEADRLWRQEQETRLRVAPEPERPFRPDSPIYAMTRKGCAYEWLFDPPVGPSLRQELVRLEFAMPGADVQVSATCTVYYVDRRGEKVDKKTSFFLQGSIEPDLDRITLCHPTPDGHPILILDLDEEGRFGARGGIFPWRGTYRPVDAASPGYARSNAGQSFR